jgi:hypothetical protein
METEVSAINTIEISKEEKEVLYALLNRVISVMKYDEEDEVYRDNGDFVAQIQPMGMAMILNIMQRL